jgi:hypothetical protein
MITYWFALAIGKSECQNTSYLLAPFCRKALASPSTRWLRYAKAHRLPAQLVLPFCHDARWARSHPATNFTSTRAVGTLEVAAILVVVCWQAGAICFQTPFEPCFVESSGWQIFAASTRSTQTFLHLESSRDRTGHRKLTTGGACSLVCSWRRREAPSDRLPI